MVFTLHSHTFHLCVSSGVEWAAALWTVVDSGALCIDAAHSGGVTGVATPAVDAASGGGAVGVSCTVTGRATPSCHWVTKKAVLTQALVAAGQVAAYSSLVAGAVLALVYVLTSAVSEAVPSVAGAGASVIVHPTAASATVHIIARVCTLVVVSVAVFIQCTIIISNTLDLEAANVLVVGVAHVARGTVTGGLVTLDAADS